MTSAVPEPPATFDREFLALTGEAPFPWQRALFGEFVEFVEDRLPTVRRIPTGLGKTATIAVWLLALARHAERDSGTRFPRRLVYVVNRRTVVDQSTTVVEGLRVALASHPDLANVVSNLRLLTGRPTGDPLAVSTLRGQLADNAEWRDDPSRPAIVLGTVDMIGSRLLFSGYGCGFKGRPLHAGFLGQDALLVHDEAHLEPAFQTLVTAIAAEQARSGEPRGFHVLALTATSRDDAVEGDGLSPADRVHAVVRQRIDARKGLALHVVADEKQVPDRVAALALDHRESGQSILVYLRRLEHVEKVRDTLRKAKVSCQVLTGTLRGLERDALATTDPVFARFLPPRKDSPADAVPPIAGTVYLVCTSAGEVGVNLSADHLVCDLTPFDSMAQRFGRVNRFGKGDARVDVIIDIPDQEAVGAEPPAEADSADAGYSADEQSTYDAARGQTAKLLRSLPLRPDGRRDASPAALESLPDDLRHAAFSPVPRIRPLTDVLLDAWALTSVRGRLPGRPPVAPWLHGVTAEPPETHVAWREEVARLAGDVLGANRPQDLLDVYPLKPHELLRDRFDRVAKQLKAAARRAADGPVWVVSQDGDVHVTTLGALAEEGPEAVAGRTVLLPPSAGALEEGVLHGAASFDPAQRYDVADALRFPDGAPRRTRVWDDDDPPAGMRLVRVIDMRPGTDDDGSEDELTPSRRLWRWYVAPRAADDDGSRAAPRAQKLAEHLATAKEHAQRLAGRFGLDENERAALVRAAAWHDRGKERAVWQRSIGNREYPKRILAKSGGRMRPVQLGHYRHELGSLLDLSRDPEFRALSPAAQDLALHLIAAHHGRARPHVPAEEAFDPDHTAADVAALVTEIPRRYARLQRAYGRWGLAWLESLLRAADTLASQSAPAASPNGPVPDEATGEEAAP